MMRHTRPDIDDGICYGVSDIGLYPQSRERDIAAARERVRDEKFSKIYSSPLKRCRQIAEAICGDREIIFDDRLKEMNFGEWEMSSWDDIFATQEGKMWFENYLERRAPQGESFEDMTRRAVSFFSEIKDTPDDILIITHAGFIRAAMVALGRVVATEAFNIKVEYGELIKVDR